MADKVWPAAVNQIILAEGYQKALQPNVITSETTSGYMKARRAYTAQSVYHTFQMRFERVAVAIGQVKPEFQLFEDFIRDTLGSGVCPFTFPLPDAWEIKRCRIYFKGTGALPYTIVKYYGNSVYIQLTIEEFAS